MPPKSHGYSGRLSADRWPVRGRNTRPPRWTRQDQRCNRNCGPSGSAGSTSDESLRGLAPTTDGSQDMQAGLLYRHRPNAHETPAELVVGRHFASHPPSDLGYFDVSRETSGADARPQGRESPQSDRRAWDVGAGYRQSLRRSPAARSSVHSRNGQGSHTTDRPRRPAEIGMEQSGAAGWAVLCRGRRGTAPATADCRVGETLETTVQPRASSAERLPPDSPVREQVSTAVKRFRQLNRMFHVKHPAAGSPSDQIVRRGQSST